jgi:uncharacterized repeat protein (TIGR01451 family)
MTMRAIVRRLPRSLGAALAVTVLGALAPVSGASAAAPAGSIAAGPRVQAAAAGNGDTVTFTFSVRNFSDQVWLPVSFELADLSPQGWLAAPRTTPYSLVGLATLPDPLTLAPGEMRQVSATVQSDGRTHYGSVVVVAGPPAAPFARIVLKVVLSGPNAAAEPEMHLMPATSGMVKIDFHNAGDGLLNARGVLFFLSPDGRFLGRLDIPTVTVLPQGDASVTLTWPEKLPSGTVARAVLTLDGRDAPSLVNAAVP